MADWEITVDRDVCLGSGLCVAAASTAFVLAGDHSHPVASPCGADEAILLAATNCPAEAITIVDAATGQPIFPGGN
ncbi:ferredoxin [Nocardia paucivorans]|uniref:ferredoxin n=1 Tax=Nocardia paucivorans TaxID=114259 RepID=UPI0002E71199|nr:ferredoxin [Nocardia paucivorans]